MFIILYYYEYVITANKSELTDLVVFESVNSKWKYFSDCEGDITDYGTCDDQCCK